MAGRTPRLRATGTMTVKRGTRAAPPQTARVTVLFADLRGYTALAERLAPAQIVPLLEEFFRVLAKAATSHGGTVFHMAGDGMMAGFGGQDLADDGARQALVAGHSMLQQFGTIAARWRRDLSIDTGIGVGLHLGEVAMGMLGPPGHKSTTLVGDTVNVAARLCAEAKDGQILLSQRVNVALKGSVPTEQVGAVSQLLRRRHHPEIDALLASSTERLHLPGLQSS